MQIDNKFKISVKKNKKYSLCTCGFSKKIPMCDNMHRKINLKNKNKFKSIKLYSSKDVDLEMTCKTWFKEDE